MIVLNWIKELQFEAEDEKGHKIIIDTARENGGLDEGIAPLQLLLVSLAGCMAMDIVAILRKKGDRIDKFQMILDGKRTDENPRRYTKITYQIKCEGNYKREDLVRAYELSRDKFCSVLATVKNPPEFEFII
jgi:putative redox protein